MKKRRMYYEIVLDSSYNSEHVPYLVTVSVKVRGPTRNAGQVAIAARQVIDAVLAYKPSKETK